MTERGIQDDGESDSGGIFRMMEGNITIKENIIIGVGAIVIKKV
jgi:hypothetical protein